MLWDSRQVTGTSPGRWAGSDVYMYKYSYSYHQPVVMRRWLAVWYLFIVYLRVWSVLVYCLLVQCLKLLYWESKKGSTSLYYITGGRVLNYTQRALDTEKALTKMLR